MRSIFLALFFCVIGTASAQKYTFECWTSSGLEGDSCDICPSSVVESRSFDGLMIYLDSVPYKWIDQPYSVRLRPGDILEFWEHTRAPEHTYAPEKIAIALWQTHFSTIEGFRDSTFCAGVAPVFRQPRLYAAPGPDTTGYYIALSPENSAVLLKGGTNINLDNIADTIIINATGGGGGSGTVTSVAATAPAAGFTISGSPITTSGTFTFTLANDLAALEALGFSGFAARTGTDTWSVRTLTAGTGISITNGGGILGDPVISATNNGTVTSIGYVAPAAGLTITGTNPVTSTGTWTFALANDLAALEGIGTTGIAVRTAANTWSTTTITAGTNIAVTNGNGVGGNPTISTTGVPTGTGTAGRFALWTGTTTIGDDAAFTFDGGNDRMTITGTQPGTLVNEAFLNLNGGAITGTVQAIRASVNASTSLDVVVANARNISNTGAVKLELEVGGTSAADPYVLWSVPSGSDFAMGIDNSASGDPLRITPNGTAPGSTANVGVTVTTTTTKSVGVNDDTPSHEIDIDGRARATQFITRQIAPNTFGSSNFVFGNGAGTGAVYVSGSGSGNWFNIQFTTGTAPVANGTIFTCTYPTAFPFAITWPVFSAHNANAATDITKFRTGNHTDTNFTFVANGTLSASTSYAFIFHIGGSSSSTN